MRLLHLFETVINTSLLVMMAIIVALTTIDLGWSIIQDVMTAPVLRLDVSQLVDLFSMFLLVLIGSAIVLSSVWGADLGGFLTALGVGSLVLGLALQDSLGNILPRG